MVEEAKNALIYSQRAMAGPRAFRRRASRGLALAALLLVVVVSRPAAASDYDERRGRAAVRLFRSLLTADLGLEQKTLDDGTLLVVFLAEDAARAKDLTALFAGDGEESGVIRGLPLRIETTADPSLASYRDDPPAGIFIATDLGASALQSLVSFGIANRLVVYSPFEGDVERGVLAGLSVEAQVRPYLNEKTLEASSISLKSFFLKVTKFYP